MARLVGIALLLAAAAALDIVLEREARCTVAACVGAVETLRRLRTQIVGYNRAPDEAARQLGAADFAFFCSALSEELSGDAGQTVASLPQQLGGIDCDRAAACDAAIKAAEGAAASARAALHERLRLCRLGCFGGAAAAIILLW